MKYTQTNIDGRNYWLDESGNVLETLHLHQISIITPICFDFNFRVGVEYTAHTVHMSKVLCPKCQTEQIMFHNEGGPANFQGVTGAIFKDWYYEGKRIWAEAIFL